MSVTYIRESRFLTPLLATASRHRTLLSNAGALAAGTMTTSLLGFAYWWIAARSFSPTAVGFAAAAISMINLLAHVGEFGMGPFLIGHVPRPGESAARMISTALYAVVGICAIVALAYLVAQYTLSIPLGSIVNSLPSAAGFAFAVALTGFTLVLDQALVGLLRSGIQMVRNVVASVAKLTLLAALALAWGMAAGESWIFYTWVVGQAISVAVLAFALRGAGSGWRLPRPSLLKPLVGEVLSHHLLNIVLQAPSLALPFVVTVVLSPATNAAFFAAWSLVNVALLVPASLATVVYSTVAREPALMATRMRLSFALSMTACAGAGLAFLLFSGFILALFSPAYPALAGSSLQMLGFGTFGVMLKYHFVVVQRLRKRMAPMAFWLGIGAVAELSFASLGGRRYGLAGLTEGWLLAVLVEALLMLPTLVSALRRPGPSAEGGASFVQDPPVVGTEVV